MLKPLYTGYKCTQCHRTLEGETPLYIAGDSFSNELKSELSQQNENIVFAPKTIYPFNFGCPSIVEDNKDTKAGVTEITSPWADTIAV